MQPHKCTYRLPIVYNIHPHHGNVVIAIATVTRKHFPTGTTASASWGPV